MIIVISLPIEVKIKNSLCFASVLSFLLVPGLEPGRPQSRHLLTWLTTLCIEQTYILLRGCRPFVPKWCFDGPLKRRRKSHARQSIFIHRRVRSIFSFGVQAEEQLQWANDSPAYTKSHWRAGPDKILLGFSEFPRPPPPANPI